MADSIDVTIQTAPITVTVDDGTTVIVGAGTVGPAGPKGDAGTNGQGVPVGGTIGQVLAKASGTNYDTEWVDQTGGGGGGSGTVTSVTGTAPISVATGTTTPVVSIAAASTSAAGSMSASDKTKLDGVEAGATANATNAQLRDRSTHTGTQALSTISDAGTAAAKNAPAAGNAASGEVVLGSDTRLTDARTPSSHASTHGSAGSDPVTLAQSQVTNLTTDLAGKVPTTRTVNGSALTGDITVTAAPSGSAGGDLTGTYPNPTIGAGKVTVAKLSATGTADSTTFLRGDGSWSTPTATVADGAVTTAKLADDAVTSAKIADGTIVNADISASAAIATSKISGLAAIAASGSASDLTTGTVPTARLATKAVGGQDEGTQINEPATATSLLDSTITLPACVAGDVLLISAGINVTQNSGAARQCLITLKLGSTSMLVVGPASLAASATTRKTHLSAVVRVEGTSDVNASAVLAINNVNAFTDTGLATENIGSGTLALDLLVTQSATTTQNATLQYLNVTRLAA